MSLDAIEQHYFDYLDVDEVGADEADPVDAVRILRFESESLGFTTFVTLGLSESGVTAIQPQELLCSVLPGQDGAADYLVRTCARMVLSARAGFVDEDIIPSDGPLLARTRMHGVVTVSHPRLADEFNVVFGPDESITANLITLLPITDKEVALGRGTSVDALFEALEATEEDLLDVTRRSAV